MAFEFDPARQPWERQKGESAIAYKAFVEYCGMADSGDHRSLRALANSGKIKSQFKTLCAWSSENKWQDRVAAFDLHQVEERQRALLQRQEKAYDRISNYSKKLYSMVKDRLEKVNVSELSLKEAREYLKAAVEMDMIANHITPQDLDRELRQRDRADRLEQENSPASLAELIIASYNEAVGEGTDGIDN